MGKWISEKEFFKETPYHHRFCSKHAATNCSVTKDKSSNFMIKFAKKIKPFNHLLFMDDLKLYGANKDQLNSLVQAVGT